MFEFPKKQRLCNAAAIKQIFSEGDSFVFDTIRLVWREVESLDSVAIKSIIVVPKKQLRLAAERNIVKRRMKEAYRLNKGEIDLFLEEKNRKIHIAIIYQNNKILSYKVIEEKIKLILGRLREKI